MSEDEDAPAEPAMVGYKQPPAKHQFKKGVSGNPNGRPRKAARPGEGDVQWGDADFDELILDVVRRPVRVKENGKSTQTTIIDAVLKSMAAAAIAGDRKLQRELAAAASSAQRRTQKRRETLYIEAAKCKREAQIEIRRARAEGRPEPQILPNPDDIDLDPLTLRVVINGPSDALEKKEWDNAREMIAQADDRIAALKAEVEAGLDVEGTRLNSIRTLERLRRRWDIIYPSEKIRRQPGFDLVAWQKQQLGRRELKRLLSGKDMK